jgi:hypothetical protein
LKDKADSTLTALLNERIIHQNIVYKGGEYTYVDWAGDITLRGRTKSTKTLLFSEKPLL